MRTLLFLILFFFFGSTQTLLAQGYQKYAYDSTFNQTPTHHIAVQAGVATLPQILNGLGEVLYYAFSAGTNNYTNKTRTGALFAQYHYAPNKHVRFGLAIGLDHQQGDIERQSGSTLLYVKYGTYYNKTNTIALECLFVYNNDEMVKVYGKVGASMHRFSQTVDYVNPAQANAFVKYIYYSGQLTPIAVEVGKDISGFAEFGFGYNGILSAGIRGKF
jgi:hypothetical protein